MSTDIADLLHEVTDAVEPGDRLDAIRAATADSGRRTHRGWWAAGGVGLVAASVVTALALTTGGAPHDSTPGPADGSTGDETTSATENPIASRVVPVYFIGDTPSGPRLFREFLKGTGPMSAETFALDAALSGDSLDPDYRSLWPAGTVSGGYFYATGEPITIDLVGDVHDRPAGMTASEAGLAVEQLVRTAQAVFQHGRVPVRLTIDHAPTDQVLGVPASEPLSAGADLDVLALVNLSDPFEGQLVDNDAGLVVDGQANSFEGNVVITVETIDGEVLVEEPTIAGTYEKHLFPFTERLDLTDVPAGDYVVRARTDDPSGEGRGHEDTRTITVVD